MSPHNDGGPAFPVGDGHGHRLQGMSLRDYFAAAALHGITNLPSVGYGRYHQWAGEWAEWSYAVADAMLKERAKRKEAQP